jgi:HSP20 family protein
MRHDDFFAEFDAVFADLARRSRPGRFEPNCDVYLTDDQNALVVNVEIAAADPTDLRVMVEGRRLYILGRRSEHPPTDRGSLLMKEIEYGEFGKKIHLPVSVDHARGSASYRDGMLTIRLPVDEEAFVPATRTEIRLTVRRVPA